MTLTRREFMELSAAAASLYILNPAKLIGKAGENAGGWTSSSEKEWSWSGHFSEWMEGKEFKFPYDSELFYYPERIVAMRGNLAKRLLYQSDDLKHDHGQHIMRRGGNLENVYYADLSIRTKKKLDLQVRFGDRPDRLPDRESRSLSSNCIDLKGVEGDVHVTLPLEFIENDSGRVFYQILYKDGGAYRPISPVRASKNLKYSKNPDLYLFADDHKFDGRFNEALPLRRGVSNIISGLEAEYFYDFLQKSIERVDWLNSADMGLRYNVEMLKDTYHQAQTFAFMIKEGIHPDAIFDGNDGLGIHRYRLKRQGLIENDNQIPSEKEWLEIARKIWERERRYYGLFTPLVSVYKAEGNHDGGGIYHNPAHKAAAKARMEMWTQPGEFEGCSPEQNYYVVPLAGGKVEFHVLDIVKYSASYDKKSPNRPENFRLGDGQTAWHERKSEESQALMNFIVMHHLAGGWPKNPEGTKWGGYGRGHALHARTLRILLQEFRKIFQPAA